MNLYNIQTEYLQLAQALQNGELTPELESQLAINEAQLQEKGINYGLVVRNLEAECDMIDAERKRLSELIRVRNNTIERLKEHLKQAMELYGINEIKSPILRISFRKSESVDIPDLELLDDNYVKRVVTKSADKNAIKEAIKLGQEVKGASLIENQNIQIK